MLRDSENPIVELYETSHRSTLGYCLMEVTVMKRWASRAISMTGLAMLMSEFGALCHEKAAKPSAVMIYSRSIRQNVIIFIINIRIGYRGCRASGRRPCWRKSANTSPRL